MNEFSKKSNARNNVYRSTHDLSFQNNLTLKFGAITPVFCREVLPGDSFRIKPTFGIRALPLVFPCQTRMRAYLHFFYVRNRTLWKDWTDFITGTKSNLVQPYIDANSSVDYSPSSLSDYLGVPCTLYSSRNLSVVIPHLVVEQELIGSVKGGPYCFFSSASIPNFSFNIFGLSSFSSYNVGAKFGWVHDVPVIAGIDMNAGSIYVRSSGLTSISAPVPSGDFAIMELSSDFTILAKKVWQFTESTYSFSTDCSYFVIISSNPISYSKVKFADTPPVSSLTGALYSSQGIALSNIPKSSVPYRNGSIHLNALPYRAYDAIYNAFYRNQVVEPLVINGQPEYNKFVVNDSGGSDSTFYALHYRNWEDDVFTSCLPSPQMGGAPMVGVSINGDNSTSLAFSDSDGNVYSAIPVLNESKNGIKSFTIKSSTDSSVIPVSAALSSGITINDFRNVNALQRYLELSQLRGYRYRDLMDAHFNVNIRYNELLMPEFIGGCSRDINVSQITATANTDVNGVETQVGDYKAQAGLVGECNQMSCTCDEHGFIIGVMTIVPVPVYGQVLDKFWFKNSQFDYFSPEFANIGYQEVRKKEICPLNIPSADLNEAFGYQRPWYEYLSSLDRAHGLFQTSLRNFILNRTFENQVNLNGNFIKVDPVQLNDIFSSTLENDDKFLGEIYFDVRVKTAVPSSVLPKLE